MVGMFLAPLDGSIVNIALPRIASDLRASIAEVSWVANAYLLTNASLILTMGRLGDVKGLRRVYTIGFAVFGIGSLACALAPTLAVLVAARVVQAVGASMFFATGPAIVAEAFPAQRRGRAIGIVTLAVSAGLMAGPPLGGFLIGAFGWPSIFLVNVPLVLFAIALSRRVLPVGEPHPAPFDLLGSALAAATLLGLLMSLSTGSQRGWDTLTFALMGVATVSGAIFVRHELRHPHPMLDLRMLADWPLASSVAGPVVNYMAMFSASFLMPFFLLRIQGMDEAAAGIVLLASPASMAVFSPIAGRLADRLPNRRLGMLGLVGVAAGLVAISLLPADASVWSVAGSLALLGGGISVFGVPNTNLILTLVPRAHRGVGSALVGAGRTVGMSFGIALASAVVMSRIAGSDMLSRAAPLTSSEAQLLLGAVSAAARAGAVAALIGAVIVYSGGGKDPV